MKYPLAEKFKAPQGEGLHCGTPMAFVRMVGCSVGQKVCQACDTDFSKMHEALGGGLSDPEAIVLWAFPYKHMCITGGEPLDRDIRPLLTLASTAGLTSHIETSGTVCPEWLGSGSGRGSNNWRRVHVDGAWVYRRMWVTVSPKPGWLLTMIDRADEIKVIVGGLGDGDGWPTIDLARHWASEGRLVYIQPRNFRMGINHDTMKEAIEIVSKHPELRLSIQAHKFLNTR